MKKMMTLLAVVGVVLALAPAAQAAATWDGGGDGINWSDNLEGSGDGWGNWVSDPTAGGNLTLAGSTTVDTDTTSWGIDQVYVAGGTLNVVAGGTLAGNRIKPSGGTVKQTGGVVDLNDRITSLNPGTVTISGGSWDGGSWTYTYGGTLHITGGTNTGGTGPILVKHAQYSVASGAGGGTFTNWFTLDAGGVTKHTAGTATVDVDPGNTTTIKVDGIQDYLDGSGSGDDVLTLIEFSSEDPDWTNGHAVVDGVADGNGGFYVDDEKGVVTITTTGATLYIVPPPPRATMIILK